MRFGGKACEKCYAEKLFWQRDSTYNFTLLTILLAMLVLVVFGATAILP